jgi:carbonic anhydrase
MEAITDSMISRRGLLRLGSLTALAATLIPTLWPHEARSQNVICNPDRPTSPTDALAALVEGNERWASQGQQHPGEDMMRRMCVADPRNPQTPFAALISCSDSRVPPELLFDQGLGDLFEGRVAGNAATGTLVESLLYGTEHLGALLLFVLGHSDCGAVKAAVAAVREGRAHQFEFVRLITPAVKNARKIVKKSGGDPDDDSLVIPIAIDQNVMLVTQALRKDHTLSELVGNGHLAIVGGRYDLSTQLVTLLIQ